MRAPARCAVWSRPRRRRLRVTAGPGILIARRFRPWTAKTRAGPGAGDCGSPAQGLGVALERFSRAVPKWAGTSWAFGRPGRDRGVGRHETNLSFFRHVAAGHRHADDRH